MINNSVSCNSTVHHRVDALVSLVRKITRTRVTERTE